MLTQADGEGRALIEEFMATFETTPVRTLDELIHFNEANKDRAMPERKPEEVQEE